MTDMTAFERQLSGEITGLMGPVRPVDDATIFAVITATHSPRWRFQAMFSATKFVVSAAIVALFGGFLLAGMLSQPSDESAPVVGAVASPGARVEPTHEATSEPEPAPTGTDTDQADSTEQPDLPGTFSPTGSPAEARWLHTATLLRDGRVLVVGGLGAGGFRASAEVWDPMTASFSPAGSLAEARAGHTATLLPDGRVLIVGGCCYPEGPDMLTSAEVWDPETDTFTPAGSLAEAHGEHTATLLPDGRVLIVGGYRRNQHNAQTAEVWDPETRSFGPADLLAAARFHHTATLLADGGVLIVGGEGGTPPNLLADPPAEVWDPVAGSSSPAGPLTEGRFQHTATLLPDGRVLIVGGQWLDGPTYRPTAVAEIWDPVTASFSPAGSPLVEARRGHTATLLPDGRVLVVGGLSGQRINDTDNLTVHATAEIWDPVTASFSPAGSPLVEARRGHTATLLPDGRVLVVGGANDGEDAMASAEMWEPGDSSSVASEAVRTASEPTTTLSIELPAEIPEGIESGTLDTPLGSARWVHLRGDDSTLPDLTDAVPVPAGGYITRLAPPWLWRSPDLITWAPESLPMSVGARYGGLTLADDTVWLATYEPIALWQSEDSLEWAEVSLEELVPPEPVGPWLLDLGEPLTFDGITLVPFSHSPDQLLVHRAMGGTRNDRVRAFCCRGGETGVYRLSNDKGEHLAAVRFEDAGGGLRVLDAGDGTELAFLDGVELGFIELLASSDGRADVLGLAVLDQGGLVPVGLPDATRDHAETAFEVDAAGFIAYSLGRDGLVHVHRSEDGRRWTETDVVGDDPGEPTDIEGVGSWRGSLSIGQHDNTTWTQAADGSWTSRLEEPFAFPLADGSLRMHLDEIEAGDSDRDALWYRPDGGEPISIDPSDDLGIVAQIQRDLESIPGTGGYDFMPLSRDTAVLSYAGGGRRHLWIITFDELDG
jgi:hypothetical protein